MIYSNEEMNLRVQNAQIAGELFTALQVCIASKPYSYADADNQLRLAAIVYGLEPGSLFWKSMLLACDKPLAEKYIQFSNLVNGWDWVAEYDTGPAVQDAAYIMPLMNHNCSNVTETYYICERTQTRFCQVKVGTVNISREIAAIGGFDYVRHLQMLRRPSDVMVFDATMGTIMGVWWSYLGMYLNHDWVCETLNPLFCG